MKRITEALLVKLEQKAKMVQSMLDPNLYYGIDKQGKGMWLLVNGVEVPIAA